MYSKPCIHVTSHHLITLICVKHGIEIEHKCLKMSEIFILHSIPNQPLKHVSSQPREMGRTSDETLNEMKRKKKSLEKIQTLQVIILSFDMKTFLVFSS